MQISNKEYRIEYQNAYSRIGILHFIQYSIFLVHPDASGLHSLHFTSPRRVGGYSVFDIRIFAYFPIYANLAY